MLSKDTSSAPLGLVQPELVACSHCDLLHERSELPLGGRAHCQRCDAPLGTAPPESYDLTLSLAIAGLTMLLIAHLNPVFGIEVQGHSQSASLWQASVTLYREDAWLLSILVLLTTLVFPALELLAICYLLLPLRWGETPPGFASVLWLMQIVRPWVMVEVFMLGVLIAVVKLAGLADIIPGAGLGSFAAVMLLLAAAAARFDHQAVWLLVNTD